jgi:NAD(P)H-flavin reductase
LIPAELISLETRRLYSEPPLELLTLSLPDTFRFEAGQYLNVVLDDNERLPLSIASAPSSLPTIELHYRSTPGLDEAARFDRVLAGTTPIPLTLEGPFGDVRLPAENIAPVFICGGTGAAQALSMVRALTASDPDARYTLLACADHDADLYLKDLLPADDRQMFIADPHRSASNAGLRWLRENVALLNGDGSSRFVLSGSPPFVYAVTDELTGLGIDRGRLSSDVYAYAPR